MIQRTIASNVFLMVGLCHASAQAEKGLCGLTEEVTASLGARAESVYSAVPQTELGITAPPGGKARAALLS